MANILIFGDSIVQGDYDTEGGWADRIKKHCIDLTIMSGFKTYFEVYNLGRSGDTSEHLLKRIESEINVRFWEDPLTIIIIAVGINDSAYFTDKKSNFVTLERYKINLAKIYKIAKKYTDKIAFIGLTAVDEKNMISDPWAPHISFRNDLVDKYDKTLNSFCLDKNIEFIEILKKFKQNDHTKLISDGLHPNTQGHELIFETVKEFLEKKKYI